MKIDKAKEAIALAAIDAWVNVGMTGTIEAVTGVGKNFIGFWAILEQPKYSKILWLSERVNRKDTVLAELKFFKELYGQDILQDYRVEFMTYQEAYLRSNMRHMLVVADEIHDSITPSYSTYYKVNVFQFIIGLSATIDADKTYKTPIFGEFTKGAALDVIAPICYTYSTKQAQADNVQAPIVIHVIKHHLDDKVKCITAGRKGNTFKTTEKSNYSFWEKRFNQLMWDDELDRKVRTSFIRTATKKRADILYTLPSKVAEVQKLVNYLTEKRKRTLVFANSVDMLTDMLGKGNVVSSRNKDEENTSILGTFCKQDGPLTIGAFKMLEQGVNLPLDCVVIASYYGKSKSLIQRIGRLRKQGSRVGHVFIYKTVDTAEERWFRKMFNGVEGYTMKYHNNTQECLNHLQNIMRNTQE